MTNLTNVQLTKYLVGKGILKSKNIIDAFMRIDRANFIQPGFEKSAYEDMPLPISGGQTISQPTTVAFMLEKLQVHPGDKVLDVGAGSGWTTALLAELAGPTGKVYGVELLQSLLDFGRANVAKFHFNTVEMFPAQTQLGLPDKAPFHKILVSAFANEIPEELVTQLNIGGVMAIPIRNSLFKVTRITETETQKEEYPGFVFVPLIQTKKSTATKNTNELVENGEN